MTIPIDISSSLKIFISYHPIPFNKSPFSITIITSQAQNTENANNSLPPLEPTRLQTEQKNSLPNTEFKNAVLKQIVLWKLINNNTTDAADHPMNRIEIQVCILFTV